MMKINKFMNDVPKEDVLHSNGLAKVANGSTLGSAAPLAFGHRERIDRNRQSIRRYGESMIGQGDMKEIARARLDITNPLRQTDTTPSRRQLHTSRATIRPTMSPPRFKEPPTRYNPYN